MIVDEIQELWEQRPFHPFEIVMADGSRHVIVNPKWMLISPSLTTIIYVNKEGPSHKLATHLITRVSELSPAEGSPAD